MINKGSDIGGSIRIPALYCGIYGLKPTNKRITDMGMIFPMVPYFGNVNVMASTGPMGKTVDDLILIMKS